MKPDSEILEKKVEVTPKKEVVKRGRGHASPSSSVLKNEPKEAETKASSTIVRYNRSQTGGNASIPNGVAGKERARVNVGVASRLIHGALGTPQKR